MRTGDCNDKDIDGKDRQHLYFLVATPCLGITSAPTEVGKNIRPRDYPYRQNRKTDGREQ